MNVVGFMHPIIPGWPLKASLELRNRVCMIQAPAPLPGLAHVLRKGYERCRLRPTLGSVYGLCQTAEKKKARTSGLFV